MAKILHFSAENSQRTRIGNTTALEYIVITEEDNPVIDDHTINGFEFYEMIDLDDVGYLPTDRALFLPA